MSTLSEIENAMATLSPSELAVLERSVRAAIKLKSNTPQPSVLDLPPLDLGKLLNPLTGDDDLLGEMLDDTRI